MIREQGLTGDGKRRELRGGATQSMDVRTRLEADRWKCGSALSEDNCDAQCTSARITSVIGCSLKGSYSYQAR
ncbi:hypothetical protein PAECIP111893_02450 [Paenibacillus plantiphilus]|uniref:Uncharacterized protein n=1 Tax=Paenibacillus plantiphilus TaxID=2905650 RepID=A0ABM9C769_9BACL|nr:hypothetical protein [Paenibacillus plantiphilus]CAH1205901.1 hypothetical protein PAECIP111893_02450 [Paenibacillus plantiphilus]